MFIEKLNNQEIETITKNLCIKLNKGNVKNWFKIQKYNGFINVCTSIDNAPVSVRLQDFIVTCSEGTKDEQEVLTNIYRSAMYSKFGDNYIEGIKDFYTGNQNNMSR